jgi:signal transduction histidine kinase
MVRNESTRKPGRGRTRRRQSEAQLIQSANLASLGVMAEEIGHEIRSLLTVCSSAAQFILEDDLDPEFRRLCLEKILSGITRASAIIETLLRYTEPRKRSRSAAWIWAGSSTTPLLPIPAPK